MYAAAIGSWTQNDEKFLVAGASHVDAKIDFVSLDDAARRMEEHATVPRCVFVAQDADVDAIVGRMREVASLLTVPVIAVVPHPSEACYRHVFAAGADDALVNGDRGGVTRRLANLLSCKPILTPRAREGFALVAVSDLGLRRTLGKTLRRAGFDVGYAADASDLNEMARRAPSLSLVIAAEDFPPCGGTAAIDAVRASSGKPGLPALVMSAEAGSKFARSRRDSIDPESKVMSFAEEVVRGRTAGTDLRASKRMQYSTICTFRAAGSLHHTFGLTHNISREGLFIRTLDAPARGTEVWVELRAPESTQTVHLRGEVMWRREPTAIGATPFGFGAKLVLDKCPPDDLAIHLGGYERLCNGN